MFEVKTAKDVISGYKTISYNKAGISLWKHLCACLKSRDVWEHIDFIMLQSVGQTFA